MVQKRQKIKNFGPHFKKQFDWLFYKTFPIKNLLRFYSSFKFSFLNAFPATLSKHFHLTRCTKYISVAFNSLCYYNLLPFLIFNRQRQNRSKINHNFCQVIPSLLQRWTLNLRFNIRKNVFSKQFVWSLPTCTEIWFVIVSKSSAGCKRLVNNATFNRSGNFNFFLNILQKLSIALKDESVVGYRASNFVSF